MSSKSGVIIGSCDTLLACGDYSSIISSYKSSFNTYGGIVGICFSSIIGGYNNQMISSANGEFGNIIGGGCENKIDGGCGNFISSSEKSCIYGPSLKSAIIGSYNSQIYNSSNTVLIGVNGISVSSEANLVYVGTLNIGKVTQKDDIDNILVWDSSDYKVKWRDVNTISGGSGITGPQGPTGPAGSGSGSGVTGAQGPTGPAGESSVVELTDGVTINTDVSLGNVFTVTLGGSRTLANPTNPTNGKRVIWRFKQDGTGGRTIALSSDFRFGTDITSVVLSTAPNTTDYFGAIYNSLDSKWDVIAFVKGYS